MRKSYLESYYNLLPDTQQKRLLSVLKSRADSAGQTPADSDIMTQITALIAQLGKPLGDPLVKLRKAMKFGKISSRDYNDTMDEVYVDLGALFKQDNAITRTTKVHNLLNTTVLADVVSSLSKVENDIMVYKIIKNNKQGITDSKFNTFYKNDNMSNESTFSAQIDTETNAVKLPIGMSHSTTSIGGLSMANIDLYHYGGGILGTIEDESHRKDKAIDGKSDTFWAEVILTDEPIRQIYNGQTQFGSVCEIVITLFRADVINHIKFNPFSNYPLGIQSVLYTEAIGGEWIDLDITPQEATYVMEFNFDEVIAKQIKIVINQKNPSINTYKIPKQVVNNAEMWQQIVNREYSVSTDTAATSQATQDMIDYVTGWQAYADASTNFQAQLNRTGVPSNYISTGSISESVFDVATDQIVQAGSNASVSPLKLDLYGTKPVTSDSTIEVRKYEYVYGAYDIAIDRIWYMDKGEYISPKYTSNGNVANVMLDVNEVVPSGTTIEYQVATRDGEWRNILPSSHVEPSPSYIYQERLDVDTVTQKGSLRFECENAILGSVERNGILVPATGYVFTQATGSVAIASGWYASSAMFSASYQPAGTDAVVPSGVNVQFINDAQQTAQEVFIGDASRQYKVELSHFPYVEYGVINNTTDGGAGSPGFSNDDGRWLNISAGTLFGVIPGDYYDVVSVLVDGFVAINRTDYYNNIRPALTQYNDVNYPYYEYIHSGKNLYFNTELKGRTIKTIYNYMNDFVQLKALLRSNTKGIVSLTPILQDFTLKLRTI